MSEIRVRYFDGCPNWREAEARVREAVRMSSFSDRVNVVVERVGSDGDARQLRFVGSPTVLLDDVDLFPIGRSTTFGLTCRVYRTEMGLEGSPTLDQLRKALLASIG